MNRSHSFNSVHGRMPSVATGAMLANRNLIALGVSGDGDTASIGIGQFVHLMRRNLPMIYIIEDNGVYGLTKGQFSATADLGSKLKSGVINDLPPIDTCGLAIELGATFVGRSFSGDKRQLSTAMLKAAIAHQRHGHARCGLALRHLQRSRGFDQVLQIREGPRRGRLQEMSFVPHFEEIDVEYDPGTTVSVTMHDGSHLRLAQAGRRLRSDRPHRAMTRLSEAHDKGEVLTGVFYVNTKAPASSTC
jgi:2-oxoglutarate/2-oxoacid ferredoxin oxidoreductase subunit beta